MNSRTDAIINEIEKVIIGKRNVVERVLMAILSEGHILLDDVPGTGKTTLALTCSVVMGVQYQRMQFTPDVVPSDIVGFSVYNKATGGFDYKPGVVMTNLLLADEINRTSPKTQSALLEAMEERRVTVDGVTRPLPTPFICIPKETNSAISAKTIHISALNSILSFNAKNVAIAVAKPITVHTINRGVNALPRGLTLLLMTFFVIFTFIICTSFEQQKSTAKAVQSNDVFDIF